MRMTNSEFWQSINTIIDNNFSPEGVKKLDIYAAQFIAGRLIYKRFSSLEQHGCSAGSATHVVATLLAAAKTTADSGTTPHGCDFKRESQLGATQAQCIEQWARKAGCWIENIDTTLEQSLGEQIAEGGEAKVYDHGATLIKSIGLDYFIQPILALDRISLHNAYFPETRLSVVGFGRTKDGAFKIVTEQPFVEGSHISDKQIENYMKRMGFELRNPRNWTYTTPDIYLSDMHDENVLLSTNGTIIVIDCDIRINASYLRQGGKRNLITNVEFET